MAHDDIVKAGLEASYNFWSLVRFWSGFGVVASGFVTAVAAFLLWYSAHQIDQRIPANAAKITGADEARLGSKSPAAWPEWLLLKKGWVAVHPRTNWAKENNVRLFHRPMVTSGDVVRTEIILKQDDQTVAFAHLYSMGSGLSWPFDEAAGMVEDGNLRVDLDQVVKRSGLVEFASAYDRYPLDIVGVGLESSVSGQRADEYRRLSDVRGVIIAHAALKALSAVEAREHRSFRAIGLGRHLAVGVTKGSDAERKQRSVVLLALVRMRNDTITSPATSTILTILESSGSYVKFVDLDQYEYSYAADVRLSGELSWGDGGGALHKVPEVAVAEALRRRPSENRTTEGARR